jgi:hypothetical protein
MPGLIFEASGLLLLLDQVSELQQSVTRHQFWLRKARSCCNDVSQSRPVGAIMNSLWNFWSLANKRNSTLLWNPWTFFLAVQGLASQGYCRSIQAFMQALHNIYVRPWCRACSASCAIFRHYHRNAEWPILFAITSVSLCHHSWESLHHSSFLGCNAGLIGRSKAQCKWFEKLGFSLHLHTRIIIANFVLQGNDLCSTVSATSSAIYQWRLQSLYNIHSQLYPWTS